MEDFTALLNRVRHCNICEPSLPLGARPVLQAHPDARILIAGQAPGRKVHATGIPFNDPSGDRLRDWIGVDRKTFYNEKKMAIIPMGFCYPGTGKSGDLPPRRECTTHWRELLLQQLPNIELILAIGQYAIAYHLHDTKHKNLTETVKHWKNYWPEVLPLPHPSPRNNLWLNKNPWFEEEVLPVLKERIEVLTSV